MYMRRLDIKSDVLLRGRRLRDLAAELGMPYDPLIRIVNGYNASPVNFDRNVRAVLDAWDAERPTRVVDTMHGGRP